MRGGPAACARPHLERYGPAAVRVHLRERQCDGVRDRGLPFALSCGRGMRAAKQKKPARDLRAHGSVGAREATGGVRRGRIDLGQRRSISGSGCALDSMASVEVSILRISISSISPDLSSSYASKMILNLSSGVPLGVHRAQAELTRDTCLSRTPQRIYIYSGCIATVRASRLSKFYICPHLLLTCRERYTSATASKDRG